MIEEVIRRNRAKSRTLKLTLLCLLCATGACTPTTPEQELIPLIVTVPTHSLSKLPFVIAEEQGLYEKYGLNVELRLPAPEGGSEPETQDNLWSRAWQRLGRRLGLTDAPSPTDIYVDGHGPSLVRLARGVPVPRSVALAATDCSLRYYVIGRPEINSLAELRGKRLGLGSDTSTSGFTGLRLVERMGWVRGQDISIVRPAGVDELREGLVDAIVGGDGAIEAAEEEGFSVLEDTRRWNERLSGNSAMVAPGWLDQGTNREAARRFLKATVEAVALFHLQPDVAFDVMAKRYGVTDRALAEKRYRRADYVPQKPYPCQEGVRNMMEYHHLDEMLKYPPETFYDDSLMRELDESGFIDALYESHEQTISRVKH